VGGCRQGEEARYDVLGVGHGVPREEDKDERPGDQEAAH
jgi:hypothetical protein